MRRTAPLLPLFLLAAALAAVPAGDAARGCAPVYRPGDVVSIASEAAVIVWDHETKTEHFIRRANFATTSADFGFLVPTPTVPELHEAPDWLFQSLEYQTAPRVIHEEKVVREFGCDGGWSASAPKAAFDSVGAALPAAPPKVEVLKQDRVAGFDYAVLKADDPKALNDWLGKNGYQARPELVAWLKKYTDDKWVMTAFKVAGQTGGPSPAPAAGPHGADLKAVRMSFKTDKPVYPYREPADSGSAGAAPAGRLLRVYFYGDKRYTGTIGADRPWPGVPVWSNQAAPHQETGAPPAAGRTWWLTEFEDRSSPRPGTDEVYFAPAADQSTVERPPIVRTTIRTEYWPGTRAVAVASAAVPVLGIAAVYLLWRLTRRRTPA